MASIEKLAELFERFPGIGSRQAKRFVQYILVSDKNFADELTYTIKTLRERVARCQECFIFYETSSNTGGNSTLCEYCQSPFIDSSSLMVVEKDIDAHNIKKSGLYQGKFFILGGLMALGNKEESSVRLDELHALIVKKCQKGILHEIIFALNMHPNAEHTMCAIKEKIAPLIEERGLTISQLGRGISTGTELEYSDDTTLKYALENRRSYFPSD